MSTTRCMQIFATASAEQLTFESLGTQHVDGLVTCARALAKAQEMSRWASASYDEASANRFVRRAQSKRAAARGEVFALVISGTMVGCAALDDIDWVHGHASFWLWLVPEARRKHCGRVALDGLRRTAARRGIAQLTCLVPATDAQAVAWLARRGATLDGMLRRRFLLDEGRVDGALLSLPATP